MGSETLVKAAKVTITWSGGDLRVKGNGDNVQTIAMLEMAKALMLRKTLGPEKWAGPTDQIMAAKVPAFNPRQIDR